LPAGRSGAGARRTASPTWSPAPWPPRHWHPSSPNSPEGRRARERCRLRVNVRRRVVLVAVDDDGRTFGRIVVLGAAELRTVLVALVHRDRSRLVDPVHVDALILIGRAHV